MTFGVLAADSASIAGTAPGTPTVGASACGVDPACAVVVAAGASATGETAAAAGLTAVLSSRAAGAAGGFTATPAGGGATTMIGRAAAAPAGALATTAPMGGREAMAGAAGGAAMIGAAERGCGTILRGSGRVGAAAGGGAATGAGAAVTATFAGAATDAFTGPRTWRESSSFLASRAFITSPGLEMFERSILGTTGSAPWRPEAAPACVVRFASRAKCARTFSASSSSSELECVLPGGTPTPGRTSRIARDFTSSSFARSLIRTLLIRLFSMCAANRPLVGHNYSVALVAFKSSVFERVAIKNAAHLTRRSLWASALLLLPHPLRLQPLQSPRQSSPLRLLP
jgi:hypothetical protein